MMGMMGGCLAGMGLMGLAALALLAAAVAGFVYLLRTTRAGGGAPAVGEDRALALLRERYARGEIDHTEYEERRRALLRGEMEWAP